MKKNWRQAKWHSKTIWTQISQTSSFQHYKFCLIQLLQNSSSSLKIVGSATHGKESSF